MASKKSPETAAAQRILNILQHYSPEQKKAGMDFVAALVERELSLEKNGQVSAFVP